MRHTNTYTHQIKNINQTQKFTRISNHKIQTNDVFCEWNDVTVLDAKKEEKSSKWSSFHINKKIFKNTHTHMNKKNKLRGRRGPRGHSNQKFNSLCYVSFFRLVLLPHRKWFDFGILIFWNWLCMFFELKSFIEKKKKNHTSSNQIVHFLDHAQQ